jgi:membrane protein
MSSFVNTVQAKVEPWRARFEALRRRAEDTVVWRVWERLLENEFVDRSVALGAKAFISFFPFVIVIATFVGPRVRRSILATLASRFGLVGPSLSTVRQAFASSGDIRRATGLLGLVFLIFYATSFTTALQRLYLKAWRRPPVKKVVNRVRGPAWLAAVVAFSALLGALRHVLGGGPGTIAFVVLSIAASIGLWWATAWLMLNGQVRWRALLASGVVTGVALNLYAFSASVWMPNTVAKDQHQFGFFGVALALVSWFTGAGALILLGACAGATLIDEDGWLGRLARGRDASILMPGAPPPLPAPTRPMRLVNALGIHGEGEGAPESNAQSDEDDDF